MIDDGWVVAGIGDFDGNGKSDIVWQYEGPNARHAGPITIWLDGTPDRQLVPFRFGTGMLDFAGIGDFDGDGRSDILVRDLLGPTAGQVLIWSAVGFETGFLFSPGTRDLSWSIQGLGDFDGDGRTDILWKRTTGAPSSNGHLDIWFDGYTARTGTLGGQLFAAAHTVAGIGDFDGDGKSDILWRGADGVSRWLISGATIKAMLPPIAVDPQMRIERVGDFDGDGKSDVFWRDMGPTSHGALSIWYDGALARPPGTPGNVPDDGWQIIGTGSFDPTYRQVPLVKEQELDEATASLAAAGFSRSASSRSDPTCNHIGLVMSQSPAAGVLAFDASTVKVVIGAMPSTPCP